MVSWCFDVRIASGPAGWTVALEARERQELGPFATETEARHAEHAALRRWRARAAALGGHVQRTRADRWVISLPAGVEVRGGRLLAEVAAPCTRAG